MNNNKKAVRVAKLALRRGDLAYWPTVSHLDKSGHFRNQIELESDLKFGRNSRMLRPGRLGSVAGDSSTSRRRKRSAGGGRKGPGGGAQVGRVWIGKVLLCHSRSHPRNGPMQLLSWPLPISTLGKDVQ
jgi:hypothetical protein